MARKTKALIVGINDYFPAGYGGDDLYGGVNDAMEMARVLQQCGFDPRGIVKLTDAEASRDRILRELDWLVNNNKSGDSIVFFFAGHGTTQPDADGDEPIPPDEAICTFDDIILDDELNAIFRKVNSKVNVEVILDCCYSAGALRAIRAAEEVAMKRVRFMAPPPVRRITKRRAPKKKPLRPRDNFRSVELASNQTLWSACSEHGEAQERKFQGKVFGVMTTVFLEAPLDSSGSMRRSVLEQELVARVEGTVPEQTPQLDTSAANRSRNIFG